MADNFGTEGRKRTGNEQDKVEERQKKAVKRNYYNTPRGEDEWNGFDVYGSSIPILPDDDIIDDEPAPCIVPNLPKSSSQQLKDSGDEELAPCMVAGLSSGSSPSMNLEGKTDSQNKMIGGPHSKYIIDNMKSCIEELVGKMLAEHEERMTSTFLKSLEQLNSCKSEISALKRLLDKSAWSESHSKIMRNNRLNRKGLSKRVDSTDEIKYYKLCCSINNVQKVLSIVLNVYLIDNTVKWSNKNDGCDSNVLKFEKSCVEKLRVMFFGKKVIEKKEIWKDGIGLEFSKFREDIINALVLNLRNDRFKMFTKANEISEIESCSENDKSVQSAQSNSKRLTINMPEWLKKITVMHIEAVRISKEERRNISDNSKDAKSIEEQLDRRNYSDFPPNEEICLMALEKIYSDITTELHDARSRSRVVFSEEIGYMLLHWKTIKEKCRKELNEIIDDPCIKFDKTSIGKILDEKQISDMEVECEDQDAIQRNERKFQNLTSIMKDAFVFEATHDVLVVNKVENTKLKEKSKDAHQNLDSKMNDNIGLERRTIRRSINLLSVSLNMLTAFVGSSLKSLIGEKLCLHKNMLRCCYIVSVSLKGLIESYTSRSSPGSHDSTYLDLKLSDLSCTPSQILKIMKKMVTKISVENYKSIHVSPQRDKVQKNGGRERNYRNTNAFLM